MDRILAKKKSILEYIQVLGEINLSESISVYLCTNFQEEKFEKIWELLSPIKTYKFWHQFSWALLNIHIKTNSSGTLESLHSDPTRLELIFLYSKTPQKPKRRLNSFIDKDLEWQKISIDDQCYTILESLTVIRFYGTPPPSWASLVAQLVKNPPAMRETWVGKIPWRRERLPTPVSWPGEFHGLYSIILERN